MSPRTPKQFKEIREEKKAHIMDVALLHFANEGYHATTVNHIAKHAGISKGLMYNYFVSKEALLDAIIKKSVIEVYDHFDIDRDGILTGEEFELFIRRFARILKEKQSFWRLFFQLLMQNEVRERFLKSFSDSGTTGPAPESREDQFLSRIVRTTTEYFTRKKEYKGENYDPAVELNMFIISLKGFAITYIYTDSENEQYYEKTIDKIIELYK
jgi:AcrR family transcriptional regulator